MSSLPWKNCLITGASAGLGREYARALGASGAERLVLLARRMERLQALEEELRTKHPSIQDIQIVNCDLSDRSARNAIFPSLFQASEPFDLVVNNAGFGSLGFFHTLPRERELEMVQVNCEAVLDIAHRFLSTCQTQGNATLINVASTAAFQPLTFMSTYGATKAFVMELSAALFAENSERGVHVMAHCPGPTESEFHIAAGLQSKVSELSAMKTRPVIDQALQAAARRTTIHVSGLKNRFLSLLPRCLPVSLAAQIVGKTLRSYAIKQGGGASHE